MLCTKMRLSERKFRFESTIQHRNCENSVTTSATLSIGSASPFVRPCAIIKMFNDCNPKETNPPNQHRSIRSANTIKLTTQTYGISNDGSTKTETIGSQPNIDR